jgi:hypothetical protein
MRLRLLARFVSQDRLRSAAGVDFSVRIPSTIDRCAEKLPRWYLSAPVTGAREPGVSYSMIMSALGAR